MDNERFRLDKWLWAARFYRSRTLAQAACTGGKVQVDGERSKAGQSLNVGVMLTISLNGVPRTVEVLELSSSRGNATRAHALYRETAASIEQRLRIEALQKAAAQSSTAPARKPDKKQRRQLLQLHSFDDNH